MKKFFSNFYLSFSVDAINECVSKWPNLCGQALSRQRSKIQFRKQQRGRTVLKLTHLLTALLRASLLVPLCKK